MISSITVIRGFGKYGKPDLVDNVEMNIGQVIAIVGPTGSGKTTLINDIELFANKNTPTKRRVLFDGLPAPIEYRYNPAMNPIAMITQHTTFLSDLPVGTFLKMHAGIRNTPGIEGDLIQETLSFANQLTGEPINEQVRMTELSGGQTRALLIADATIICSTPIILLDEVENAGIHRTKAIELLRKYQKIFIFVTHDPRIALLSDYRIIMQNGFISKILYTDNAEKEFAKKVSKLDDTLCVLRDQLRLGNRLTGKELEGVL